jgi:hypothetical protein
VPLTNLLDIDGRSAVVSFDSQIFPQLLRQVQEMSCTVSAKPMGR